jgi:hypothetical protein
MTDQEPWRVYGQAQAHRADAVWFARQYPGVDPGGIIRPTTLLRPDLRPDRGLIHPDYSLTLGPPQDSAAKLEGQHPP